MTQRSGLVVTLEGNPSWMLCLAMVRREREDGGGEEEAEEEMFAHDMRSERLTMYYYVPTPPRAPLIYHPLL